MNTPTQSNSHDKAFSPKLSVLMAVHNSREYLESAIKSILNQTYTDFEFLITDDGSTDGSNEVIATLAKQDPRIVHRFRENRGLTSTLNELASYARAPYLARMDADDLSLPDRFEKQIRFLEKYSEVSLVGGAILIIDNRDRPIFTISNPVDGKKIDEHNLIGKVAIHHPAVIMRTSVFKQVGGYDEDFSSAQDLDLWLRMAEVSQLANLGDIVLKYRIHEGSISSQRKSEQAGNAEEACRRAWARRDIPPQSMYEIFRQSVRSKLPTSDLDYNLRTAWQAWSHGYRPTARYYFLRSIRAEPFSMQAWRGLLLSEVRKPTFETKRS